MSVVEKAVETVDEHAISNWVQFQTCGGIGAGKMLGSVSRLVQANHTVEFRLPARGSCIANNANGYRSYLGQDHVSYSFHLLVQQASLLRGRVVIRSVIRRSTTSLGLDGSVSSGERQT